jgi:predicted hotdog family 3-hydroxylacyl-ACP dehydratase
VSLPIYPIEATVPHRSPMMVIEEMLARQPGQITVGLTIRADSLFFRAGRGIPAHVALEWMAQACAAYGGADGQDRGLVPRIGFLLGTRDFQATRRWFGEGEQLQVTAKLDYRDEELAHFSCHVEEVPTGAAVARASLTVFHPPDAKAVIAGSAGSTS